MLFFYILLFRVLTVSLCFGVSSVDGDNNVESELNADGTFNFLNIVDDRSSVSSMLKNALHFIIPSEMSRLCLNDLTTVIMATLKVEEWAFLMFDSFGKPGSGILDGNFVIEGNYKECIHTKKYNILGKYCWAELTADSLMSLTDKYLNITIEQSLIKHSGISFKVAICIPSSCVTEIKELSWLIIERFGFKAKDLPEIQIKCAESPLKDLPNDTMTLIAIGVLSMFVFLVIIGTCLDLKSKNHGIQHHADKMRLKNENNSQLISLEIKTFDEESKSQIVPNKDRTLAIHLLLFFSAYSNWKKLFQGKHEKHSFLEINGLRVLIMSLVIYAQTWNGTVTIPISDNPMKSAQYCGHFLSQFLLNFLYVDVFFVITGFLTFNGILQTKTKRNHSILQFAFNYIVERYLRMAVVPGIYLLVFYSGLTYYLGSGPHWKNIDPLIFTDWWRNILFICNWWEGKCLPVWWFMAVSIQLHVLSLFIVIPIIKKNYRLSVLNGGAILIWSWYWLFWTAYQNDVPPSYSLLQNRRDISTYFRLSDFFYDTLGFGLFFHYGAYCSGILASWILFRYKDRIIFNKVQMAFSWLVWCVIVYFLLGFMYYEHEIFAKSLFVMFSSTIMGLCVAWLLVVCFTNNGGIVSAFLRCKLFALLGKLTMTVYLTHWLIITHFYQSEEVLIHFSENMLFAFFLRNWIFTFMIAIPISLIIDAPLDLITKLVKNRFLLK